MQDPTCTLVPRAAFADLSAEPVVTRGVTVCDLDGLGIATIIARRGQSDAFTHRMQEYFGIELPQGPHHTIAGDLALAGTGPGMWLATRERGGNAFAVALKEAIGDLASISDQSDGYAVLRLSGLHARDVLCKLVPIDVDPRAFRVGDVASTIAAHIGVTFWRLEDGVDGSPIFEVAIFRSLAKSFWDVLSKSTAEFGLCKVGF
jgi:methylglutamate dehydrogenase subunit D